MDYWLLDDDEVMTGPPTEGNGDGLFIRSTVGSPDLIKFEHDMERLNIDDDGNTLFLNKEVVVVEEEMSTGMDPVKPRAVKAEGIFLRSDMDDWVSV